MENKITGKELFVFYEVQMGRIRITDTVSLEEAEDRAWDAAGRQKKLAWNSLADLLNQKFSSHAR